MPFRSIMPWMKPELRAFGNGEIIACQDVSPTMGGLEFSRGGTGDAARCVKFTRW